MAIPKEELDGEIEGLAKLILRVRKLQKEANLARKRLIKLITNPEHNQGTDKRPRYETPRFIVTFAPIETLHGKPSQVVHWVLTHFKDPKDQQEVLDQLFSPEISKTSLRLIEQKGRNVQSLKKILEAKPNWRVNIRKKEG